MRVITTKLFVVFVFTSITIFAQNNTTNQGTNSGDQGNNNSFFGANSGRDNTSNNNSFFGANSGQTNTTGQSNVFIGRNSGRNNVEGSNNVFNGNSAGFNNATGNFNTFLGTFAGRENIDGRRNVFIGGNAGRNAVGSGNVFVGYRAGFNELNSNKLYVENTDSDIPLIYGDFTTDQLGVNTNSIPDGYNFAVGGNTKISNNISIDGNIGVGADSFDGVKAYVKHDVTTAPTYGTASLFSFASSSHTTGELSKVRGAWFLSLNNSTGILNESMGIDVGAGNESSGTGIVNNAYGINVDVQNGTGTVENGYGLFIKRVQANNSYGIYQQGETTQNYFAGNVSIGTTLDDPDYALTVKGKMHVQEVKVDLLGAIAPDYVFYKDYNLKTLEQVEAYINLEGHLPNIPSALEMEEEGVNLKEMNMKLLEKVEELTLYTIAQEKAIKEQKEVNQKLENRLERLEKLLLK
ncbi:hypothetical protein SAMN04487910_0202 [Aquimarina amphilecti]|uniref:Chaperone of endosialidase n=1 Tax=Aquimarina amphilecti TaxID=1038014 RepID=A0A1H7FWZ5_AQUAM|nr:tail fiber protein [Aquimarina amphilecti]SEK30314.1 hypothetical protein SAMN04487910_0202 [Aquimarina amphilecti]